MDLQDFSRRAEALALTEEASQVPGFEALAIEAEAGSDPLRPGAARLLEIRDGSPDPAAGAPRYVLALHHGAFEGDEGALERALLFGLERIAERAAADEAIRDDEALFQAHAAFVRDMEVPAGWYRRGERLGSDAWAVDLDVFVDLVLSREAWDASKGKQIVLRLMGEELELEVPDDAEPDEAWTLQGGGLFEPAPGIEEDEMAEDDGRYGDLHIVPYVY